MKETRLGKIIDNVFENLKKFKNDNKKISMVEEFFDNEINLELESNKRLLNLWNEGLVSDEIICQSLGI